MQLSPLSPRFSSALASTILLITGMSALTLGTAAHAQVTFFSDRASFEAANPGLPIEDFEEARVNPDQRASFSAPLSSASDDAIFRPGEILPGITLSDRPGPSVNELLAAGTGAIGTSTKAVGAAEAVEIIWNSLDLSFASGVRAVGFDLFAVFRAEELPTNTTITVSVFGSSGLLGEQIVSTAGDSGGDIKFLGVSSASADVIRINVDAQGLIEFVDNVAFGAAPVAAPEPATLGLLACAALPGLCTVLQKRGKNAQQRNRVAETDNYGYLRRRRGQTAA